jgi:hypothetical protein
VVRSRRKPAEALNLPNTQHYYLATGYVSLFSTHNHYNAVLEATSFSATSVKTPIFMASYPSRYLDLWYIQRFFIFSFSSYLTNPYHFRAYLALHMTDKKVNLSLLIHWRHTGGVEVWLHSFLTKLSTRWRSLVNFKPQASLSPLLIE